MEEDEPDVFEQARPFVQGVVTILIACAGTYGCAMVGSLSYPGVGAIVGGFSGFFCFLIFGSCVTCFWKQLVPESLHQGGFTALLVPSRVQELIGGHGDFNLILTVHQVSKLDWTTQKIQKLNVFSSVDAYILIECGKNPRKSTCVNSNYEYNEQFKLKVSAADVALHIKLMEQDVFGSKKVAQITVNINDDVIAQGFPQKHEFPLENRAGVMRDHNKSVLVLSFDYMDGQKMNGIVNRRSADDAKAYGERAKLAGRNHKGEWVDYSTINHITHTHFKPADEFAKMHTEKPKKNVPGTEADPEAGKA